MENTIFMVTVDYGQDLETTYFYEYKKAVEKFNYEFGYQLNNSLKYLKENKHAMALGKINNSKYTIEELGNHDNDMWDEANEWLDKTGYDICLEANFQNLDKNTNAKWFYYIEDYSKFIIDEMLKECYDTRIWYTKEQYDSWVEKVRKEKETFERYHDMVEYANVLSEIENEIIDTYGEIINELYCIAEIED